MVSYFLGYAKAVEFTALLEAGSSGHDTVDIRVNGKFPQIGDFLQ